MSFKPKNYYQSLQAHLATLTSVRTLKGDTKLCENKQQGRKKSFSAMTSMKCEVVIEF